jgi:hypothetical protein
MTAMRAFVLGWQLFPLVALAADSRVEVGMSRDKAISIIKMHGGKDITPGLAEVGPKGEHPLHGMYWSFDRYGAVVAIGGKEKVDALTYWTAKDFGTSKDHRSKTAKKITAFTVDQKVGRIRVETKGR